MSRHRLPRSHQIPAVGSTAISVQESSMASKKSPNPIDTHVGSRVRLRRMMFGMSQEKLGERLGITFQQIQKYEKGTNRIGASRLQAIARVLSVPVSFFFEDAPGNAPVGGEQGFDGEASTVMEFLSTAEGLRLNRAFRAINDHKVRHGVVALVQALAGVDDGGATVELPLAAE